MSHTPSHPRAFTTRQLGLALAAGTAVAGVALVAWFATRAPAPASQPASQPAPSVPNVRDLPASNTPTLGSGDKFFIQFVDRSDPTRLGGEITAARSTPQPDGRYDLTQPVAWFFLDDGRSVLVTSDEGTIVMPAGARSSTPDRGSLEGDVRVKVFAKTSDGRRPAPDTPALATLRTPRMTIDWTLGQLELPDAVAVTSDVLTFEGRGVIAQFDASTKRLESLHITQTSRAVYDPAAQSAFASPAPQPSALAPLPPQAAASPPAASQIPPSPGDEPSPRAVSLDIAEQTLFTITMEGDVRIERDGQELTGDRVEAWARTIDHRLPDRTSLRVRPTPRAAEPALQDTASSPSSPSSPAAVERTTSATDAQPANQPGTPVPPSKTAITLAFTGPLDVRRVVDAPPQLQRDDLLMRVLAEGDADAQLASPAQGVMVTARQLEYAATRREVAMVSAGPTPARLIANQGDSRFSVAGARVEASLATGVARVLSPGQLVQHSGSRQIALLTWTDQAQFDLVPPTQPDGMPQARLLGANILGGVEGALEQGTLAADTLVATFAGPADTPGDASALQLLRLVGSARLAAQGRDNAPADSLRASTIAVEFDPAASTLTPTRVRADGGVQGQAERATLHAESLDAVLGLDAQGRVEARQIDAASRVIVTTSDGVVASADKLTALPREQQARLMGAPATLTQRASELAAPAIALDGVAQTILATGSGSLRSQEGPDAGQTPRSVLATWSESFAFSDATGLAKLQGDARVEVTQGPTVRDTTSAASIEMSLAPRNGAAAQPVTGVAAAMVSPAGDRDVLWILASGSPARVRSERFDPSDPARRTRLLSLSSPTIRADVPQQMLRAAGAGQLVTSEDAPAPAGPQSTFDPSQAGPAGQALFTWSGYADFEQAAGVATMHDNVRMIYRASPQEQPAELETKTLRATFTQAASQSETQLQSVFASGGVWARNQGREMTAATLTYDPALSLFDAQGSGAVLVDVAGTPTDPPMSARQVRWNLRTNRVEVIEPAPTVVPR